MAKEKIVLLYGGRSAEREVSVLSAESVMRAINYDKYSVETYFITPDRRLHQDQTFEEKPAETERLMTNDTIDWEAKSISEQYLPRRSGCLSSPSRTNGRRWIGSRFPRSLETSLCGM